MESETAQLSPDPEMEEEEQVQTKDLADGRTACPDGQTGYEDGSWIRLYEQQGPSPAEAPVRALMLIVFALSLYTKADPPRGA